MQATASTFTVAHAVAHAVAPAVHAVTAADTAVAHPLQAAAHSAQHRANFHRHQAVAISSSVQVVITLSSDGLCYFPLTAPLHHTSTTPNIRVAQPLPADTLQGLSRT
ncbi:hypothetical protein LIA77_10319 [Sarocladium implicatum]|nr:hypothetical protein LIA77_10319 [Sarocladium implicatum]